MRTPIPSPRGLPAVRRSSGARARPLAGGLSPSPAQVELIDHSHERCAALGVSRIENPGFSLLSRPDLALVRERNQRLNQHAAPVMEMLYEQIVNSQSMVVLTDAIGTVLHSIGDDDFLERASKVALKPGVNWAEQIMGTNAIGTALVEEVPTLVHADEHYLHANHFLTCSAAPILDPRGNILGVLDVTGDHRSYHPHTMALVKLSARMIENHWLTDEDRQVLRLHFHTRAEFIGTLMEGILAVSPDGRIVGANRGALEQLGISGVALRMHTLTSLLGTSVGALVDRFRASAALPLALTLAGSGAASGRRVHVLARFHWPVWTSLAESSAAPASTPSRPAVAVTLADAKPPSALAALDTGDEQLGAAIAKLRRVLDHELAVLIVGDTGTGKQMLARAMHADSARRDRPFVVLDGDGSPAQAIDVGGGTLYIDELGSLAAPLQARLLQRLQAGEHGAPRLAVISATRHTLRGLVDSGQLREDLAQHLSGLVVKLPPLRQRCDLQVLLRRLLAAAAPGRALQVAPEVLALFEQHGWPGNLRQLANVVRAACLLAGDGDTITCRHLPDDFLDATGAACPVPAQTLGEVEIDLIRRTLDAAGGNISEASKRLGVSRNTIYRKLRWPRAAT